MVLQCARCDEVKWQDSTTWYGTFFDRSGPFPINMSASNYALRRAREID